MAEAMNLQKLRPLGLQGPYEFSTLLLDPPRAGLNDRTRKMAESFDHVTLGSVRFGNSVPNTSAELESLGGHHRLAFDGSNISTEYSVLV